MTSDMKQGYDRFYGALTREYTPDRVPLAISTDGEPFAKHYGMSRGEMFREGKNIEITKRGVEEFGRWDADLKVTQFGIPVSTSEIPIKFLLPGIDLPDDAAVMADEREYIKVEDYDKIIDMGWEEYWKNYQFSQIQGIPVSEYDTWQDSYEEQVRKCQENAEAIGIANCAETIMSNVLACPFFAFSLGRSFTPFAEDLFFRKDKVKKALQSYHEHQIESTLQKLEGTKAKTLIYCEERAGGMFPLHIFEEFWMPYALEFIDAMHSRGITTMMHIDMNWIKNLPLFKKFPKGAVCICLDSTTPIFEAKELLGDHVQYMGDVPATLLSFGKPEEVTAYCQDLVKNVGKNGGFILSSGCEFPPDAKMENYVAMREVALNSKY